MDTIEQMDLPSILSLFNTSSLSEMELSCSRYTIKLKRPVRGQEVSAALDQPKPTVVEELSKTKSEQEELQVITSPIVGTFYLTPAPDAPPYVKAGSKVEKNQVICTIEAMKLMNQLESEFACEIVEVLVKPETLVEFGQPLFKVRRI
jgi:acetyl-CoA carboxylase biotin carboxyl carrier protein